jgi:hypothetical protein
MNTLALSPPLGLPARRTRWAELRVAIVYFWRHGRWPRLDRPERFTEWVQWRKLNDRRHALAKLTDKAQSKAIAEARLGAEHVIPTLWLGEQLPEVAMWNFPFIVKANHGCRQFVVVRGEADYARAKSRAPRWLARAYGGWLDEWHYGAARRLILVEPYIGGAELPLDYKIYVFGGRAEVVQVHVGRGAAHRWIQFDRAWLPLSNDRIDAPPPGGLNEMLAAAEAMAGQEDFLRVDFYCEDGQLLFGEYCLFPGSGLDAFRPDTLDRLLGDRWAAARQPI